MAGTGCSAGERTLGGTLLTAAPDREGLLPVVLGHQGCPLSCSPRTPDRVLLRCTSVGAPEAGRAPREDRERVGWGVAWGGGGVPRAIVLGMVRSQPSLELQPQGWPQKMESATGLGDQGSSRPGTAPSGGGLASPPRPRLAATSCTSWWLATPFPAGRVHRPNFTVPCGPLPRLLSGCFCCVLFASLFRGSAE